MTTPPFFYYFHTSGRTFGPLNPQQIETLINRQQIAGDTLAWTEGMAEWKPAAQVTDLVQAFPVLENKGLPSLAALKNLFASLTINTTASFGSSPSGALSSGDKPTQPTKSAAAKSASKAETAPRDPSNPHGVHFRLHAPPHPFAPFSDRLLAGLIDSAILMFAAFALMLVTGEFDRRVAAEPSMNPIQSWVDMVIYAGLAAYFIIGMSNLTGGQTIGYWVMRLRLVSEKTLKPVDLAQATIWYVFTWISLIGWVFYFFDDKGRMLHNMGSRTAVILDVLPVTAEAPRDEILQTEAPKDPPRHPASVPDTPAQDHEEAA